MANFFYPKAKESLFKGQIDIISNQIKILLIDTSLYAPSVNTDTFVSDIPPLAIKDRSDPVQNVNINLGIVDADDVIIADYPGHPFSGLIGYQVGSSDSSSRLLFHIDTAVGLPFTGASSTSPVTIVWNNEINKIISL